MKSRNENLCLVMIMAVVVLLASCAPAPPPNGVNTMICNHRGDITSQTVTVINGKIYFGSELIKPKGECVFIPVKKS